MEMLIRLLLTIYAQMLVQAASFRGEERVLFHLPKYLHFGLENVHVHLWSNGRPDEQGNQNSPAMVTVILECTHASQLP